MSSSPVHIQSPLARTQSPPIENFLATILPAVVQYWLTNLSIAQPMMRLQRCGMFHIAWNLWGAYN